MQPPNTSSSWNSHLPAPIASTTRAGPHCTTPAANNPDPAVVHALIALGFGPDVTDDDDETPLHVAVQFAERRIGAAAAETIILALIGVGADVNARAGSIQRVTGYRTSEGWTPLMYAAYFVEDIDIVRALLNSGARSRAHSGAFKC